MAVVCNSIRMGRWSGLMVVCVCHSDEVIREADANYLGLEMLTASWLPLVSVVPGCQNEW